MAFFYDRYIQLDEEYSFAATCTAKAYNWLESDRTYPDRCLCHRLINLYYPACRYCVSVVEMDRDSAADGIALRLPPVLSRFVCLRQAIANAGVRVFHQAEPTLRDRKFPVPSPQIRSRSTDPILQIIALIISQFPSVPQSPRPLVPSSPRPPVSHPPPSVYSKT